MCTSCGNVSLMGDIEKLRLILQSPKSEATSKVATTTF